MNRVRMTLIVLSFACVVCFIFERPAHAYLDMGTGSFFLQVAIASFLGVLVTLKIYWRKLKKRLALIFSRKKDPPDNEV